MATPLLPIGAPNYEALLGVTGTSPQFGILGKVMGRTIALDLNQTHTISLFGVQGGGKSYTLGSIIEMASLVPPGINQTPSTFGNGSVSLQPDSGLQTGVHFQEPAE